MTEDDDIKELLAKFGLKPTNNKEVDFARLQEAQTKAAVDAKQELQEASKTTFTPTESVSYPWYSLMYQLGLDPTGNPEQDYKDIMALLVDKVKNAKNESEFVKYMSLISLVDDLFIESGISISNISADKVSAFLGMDLLSSYNQNKIEGK